jgi:putative endonuclease
MEYFFVYILANKKNGTLYIGFTYDLEVRVYQHKHEEYESFTKRYHIHRLVYYEIFEDADAAIDREKQLKKWNRGWKLRLIEKHNPGWKELYASDGSILPLPNE